MDELIEGLHDSWCKGKVVPVL